MNQRQENLVRLLSERKRWMTGKELAGLLGVSDRTIRSDIAVILKEQGQVRILSNRRHGYRMDDRGRGSPEQGGDGQNPVPVRPVQRSNHILKILLEEEQGLSLADLKEQLFFSDSSIEKDIARVKAMVKTVPDIALRRFKNQISLEGTELAKRRLCQKILLEWMGDDFLNLNKLASCFTQVDLIYAWNELEQILKDHGYKVREAFLPMLETYIGVSLERILAMKFIALSEYGGPVPEKLNQRAEYRIAGQFFSRVLLRYGRTAVSHETHILALLLCDQKSLLPDSEGMVGQMLGQVLEQIYTSYQIDFREDEELIRMLNHHLSALLYQKWNRGFQFPLSGQEIKSKYPLAFEIACFMADFLEERTKQRIGETEIGFIALHLQCAYERIQNGKLYRLLVICPYNHGLLSHFLDRIAMHFGQRAAVIGCFPMFEEERVRQEKPDVILTTSALKHNLNIPTLHISLFMNMSDENQIFETLNRLDSQRFKAQFLPWMAAVLYPQFFYTDLEAETPEEAIRFLCSRLEEAGYVPPVFTQSVLERERMSGTSFAFQFAMPHPLHLYAFRSVLSVAFFKRPVIWGQYEVSLVLLPAVAEEDRRQIEEFFNWMGSMITEPGMLAELLKSRTWTEFRNLFQ